MGYKPERQHMMKRTVLLWVCLMAIHAGAMGDTLRLDLDGCIMMARKQSVDAAVAIGELKAAYWAWRSYKADLLPRVSFSATVPAYNKRYNTYQREDGTVSYVRNNYMELDGSFNITQKIWSTGGTLSVESSLDWLRQISGNATERHGQFMSMPIALTLRQPLFGINTVKWDRRIEPLRYREAKSAFLTATEQVAMRAISVFFNLILANEQLRIADQNLQNAEKLYEVAEAKREMGKISKNDLLQMRLSRLNAQSALTNAESNCKARMFELKALLNVESDIEPVIPEKVPGVTLVFQEVLDHALNNNALAITMQRRQLQAEESLASAKSNRQSVTLYAQAGYTGTSSKMHDAYHDLLDRQVVQIGLEVPLLDWGRQRGQIRVAESNRDVVKNQLRQQSQEFRQNLFILTEQFNNQLQQLRIAEEADTIAQRRYNTNVETFKSGSISTLELSDTQTSKDEARRNRIAQLYNYWYYYYQIRSITLWDFEKDRNIDADFEEIVK